MFENIISFYYNLFNNYYKREGKDLGEVLFVLR